MTLDHSYFEEMEAKIPHGKVRTRFAPSPTGYMHVGNLRPRCTPGSSPAATTARLSCGSRTPTRAVRWRALWMSSTAPWPSAV